MIRLAIKKILHNKFLMLSLFAGILIAVVIAASIPVYASGIAHRMFVTQLENFQNENGYGPGTVSLSCSLSAFKQTADESQETVEITDSSANVKNFDYCNNYLENDLYRALNMPAMVKSVTMTSIQLVSADSRDKLKNDTHKIYIRACSTYENAVELLDGRMPVSSLDSDGCIEVIISLAAQRQTGYTLGSEIHAGRAAAELFAAYIDDPLKLKIVGVFDYISDPLNPLAETDSGAELYADYSLFREDIFIKRNYINKVNWYYAGDYTAFDLTKTDKLIASLDKLNKNLIVWGLDGKSSVITPPIDEFRKFNSNISSVNILLTLFYAPVLILVAFFIFMISEFVIENDKNEVSMLTSRGASRWQIMLLYLCQGGIFALLSVIIAPLIAPLLCSILGATSGFLEFSQRAPMKINLSFSAVLFGLAAGALSVITMLIPVYKASKVEIVVRKRSKLSLPVWQNIIVAASAVLTGLVSAYAYYTLVVQKSGLLTPSGKIQPLAYLLLICFFACGALIFILAYPFVLRLILRTCKKNWNPQKFVAYSRISRMALQEKFIIVFITLTVALGAFSSVSARTMNSNMDKSARYKYPCDMIVSLRFSAQGNQTQIERKYFFDKAEDTQSTRVVIGNKPTVRTGYRTNLNGKNVTYMGINPKEFSEIITWDDSILPRKMSEYMKMLSDDPSGCILSTNAAKELNVTVGSTVFVVPDSDLRNNMGINATVLAVVDAWPTFYANQTSPNGAKIENYLVVVNRSASDEVSSNLPYEAWLNTSQNTAYFRQLAIKNGGRITSVVNGAKEIYISSINGIRQAINGSLTMGFISVMVVALIGFTIYWIISIKNRTLQIGTMRALGMSLTQVNEMILSEQGLICILPIILGVVCGLAGGIMFAPLLQSAFDTIGSMPPYTVAFSIADMIKLALTVILLVAIGTVTAMSMLKKIKAASAIKLGEE